MESEGQTIKPILKAVASQIGINFLEFKIVLGFGGEFEFDVCELINKDGLDVWCSIDIKSSVFSSRINYEPGYGTHWGEILFCASQTKDFIVVIDPELSIGLIFQSSDCEVSTNTEVWETDFYYTAEWRKECTKDSKVRSYIDEWPALLGELTKRRNISIP